MEDALAIDDAVLVRRKAAVVGADVADDAILLDVDTGYFFQLNRTGARIWAFVREPQSVGAVCDRMAAGYAVDRAECRRDVTDFIADLIERGVLEVAD